MDNIYDVIDDPEKLYYVSIERDFSIPSFVKTANDGVLDRNSKQVFAWESKSRFPLDTPEDVIMSHMYFEKTAHKIPYSDAVVIRQNINRVADFMNISFKPFVKAASVQLEIPLNDFAVSLPLIKVPSEVLSKYANHVYGDSFVLYPLDTPENVHKANTLFPNGLDNELEFFRPSVAQAIIEKTSSLGITPSHKVLQYGPIPMSVVMDQLDYRILSNTEKTAEYQQLKDLLDSEVYYTPVQLAEALSILDNQTNMMVTHKSANLIPAKDYIRGVYEDRELDTTVTILDRSFPVELFSKLASSLSDMYPDAPSWGLSGKYAQRVVDNMNQLEQEHLVNLLLSRKF